MLSIGIQPFSVNLSGVLCIELIVQNLPTETAWMALENYYEKDNIHRRELYHMIRFSRNYMAKIGGAAKKYQPPTILEVKKIYKIIICFICYARGVVSRVAKP